MESGQAWIYASDPKTSRRKGCVHQWNYPLKPKSGLNGAPDLPPCDVNRPGHPPGSTQEHAKITLCVSISDPLLDYFLEIAFFVYRLPIGICFGGLNHDGFAADGTQDGRRFLSPEAGKQKQQTRRHFRFQKFRDFATGIAHLLFRQASNLPDRFPSLQVFPETRQVFSLKSGV